MEERLANLLKLYYSEDGSGQFVHYFTDEEVEDLTEYLIKNDVVALPYRVKLPDELWRYLFDNNERAVPVKCKLGKTTEYGFTLIYKDGREWRYKYSDLGVHVFYSKEAVEKKIEEQKLNDWIEEKS